MLLTIMAIIGKHQELPRERWQLYDHAASVLIQHWDVNKHLKDKQIATDFIGEEDKKELLRRLAYKMQGGDAALKSQPPTFSFTGNYIYAEQLQAEFEGYLRERYAQTPDRAKVIAEAMIHQFRERNLILSLYGANLYGFVHRAFLEYFCASAFVRKFEKTQKLTLAQAHNLNAIAQAPGVIAAVCAVIERTLSGGYIQERSKFLEEQIVRVVETAGMRLPIAEEQIVGWLKRLSPPKNAWFYAYANLFGRFVGNVVKGARSVHQILLGYLSSQDANYRVLAPYALAVGWRDDAQTLPLLRDRAVNDKDEDVRRAAVEALAKH